MSKNSTDCVCVCLRSSGRISGVSKACLPVTLTQLGVSNMFSQHSSIPGKKKKKKTGVDTQRKKKNRYTAAPFMHSDLTYREECCLKILFISSFDMVNTWIAHELIMLNLDVGTCVCARCSKVTQKLSKEI